MKHVAHAVPELTFDVGMSGSSLVESTLEPVTVAVMIIVAIMA